MNSLSTHRFENKFHSIEYKVMVINISIINFSKRSLNAYFIYISLTQQIMIDDNDDADEDDYGQVQYDDNDDVD